MKKFLKRYKKWILLLYFPIQLILFSILETIVTNDSIFWVTNTFIDKYIPFVPFFVSFYVFWYVTMVGITIYLFIKDEKIYTKYMYFIIIGYTFTLLFDVIIPNGQTLRPIITSNDIFSRLIAYIYSIDTYTNVFPSMHVIGCLGSLFGILKTKTISQKWIKISLIIISILICLSTIFIKQHAVIDVLASIIVSVILYLILFKEKKKN